MILCPSPNFNKVLLLYDHSTLPNPLRYVSALETSSIHVSFSFFIMPLQSCLLSFVMVHGPHLYDIYVASRCTSCQNRDTLYYIGTH